MPEAAFKASTPTGVRTIGPRRAFRSTLDPVDRVNPKSDTAVLKALIDEADVIGTDQHGDSYLLIRTSAELLDWLATLGADTEDCEADDPAEESEPTEDAGDREFDLSDYEAMEGEARFTALMEVDFIKAIYQAKGEINGETDEQA